MQSWGVRMGFGGTFRAFAIALWLTPAALAATESDLAQFGLAYNSEKQTISGSWPGQLTWDSDLCEGSYRYDVKASARIDEETGFEFLENGSVAVHARLTGLAVTLDGSWRSTYTFCREVAGSFDFTTEWLTLDARIDFPTGGLANQLTKPTVVIVDSTFGPMHMPSYVPGWIENKSRDLARRALIRVWQNNMSAWVDRWFAGR